MLYLHPEDHSFLFGQIGYRYGQDGEKFLMPNKEDLHSDDRFRLAPGISQSELLSGNIYIRHNGFAKKGDIIPGHKHYFDHTMFVYKGSVEVETISPDEHIVKTIVSSPYCQEQFPNTSHFFLIRAEVKHKLTALVDDTVFDCIFSLRDDEGKIVQDYRYNLLGHALKEDRHHDE